MDTRQQSLLKIFAVILKKRSTGDITKPEITPSLIKHFSRRQLLDIIDYIFYGDIPKEYHLTVMENEELLKVILDDMFIIAYVIRQWSDELISKRNEKEKVEPQKPKPNEKRTTTTSKSNKSS